MNHEKIKILKLLEDGKITADEAARLLEASGDSTYRSGSTSPKEPSSQKQDNFNFSDHRQSSKSHSSSTQSSSKDEYRSTYNNSNNQRSQSPKTSDFDSFANEISRKFETLVKDFEPRIQKFTETFIEKTASAADKFSQSFSAPTASSRQPRGSYEHSRPRPASTGSRGYDKNIELYVPNENSELIISGLNAPILLKGYNGDKISAKLFCIPKRPDARIELSALGSKFFLDYDENDFEKVAIDAFIPEKLFRNITVSNYNGEVKLSTLSASFINAYTSNGDIIATDLYSENLKLENENGKEMHLTNIISERALIESYNARIIAHNVEVANLKMNAFNAAINMNVLNLSTFDNYIWAIEASNNQLGLNLPTFYDVGYYIKARTSLGTVKVGLTGLSYISNAPEMLEAKSIDFDRLPKKVSISLETSNSNLIVN